MLLLLLIILAAILFGLGFVVKWLFIAAAIVFIVFLVNLAMSHSRHGPY